MEPVIIEKWNEYSVRLQKYFTENVGTMRTCDYEDVVRAVISEVINAGNDKYNLDEMVTLDHGEYQGSQLFIIPRDVYQPTPQDYLATYVYYGSCSGCDTLLAIQDESDTEFIRGLMTLSLHLIQNMRHMFGGDE